jgi:hypothetical protein
MPGEYEPTKPSIVDVTPAQAEVVAEPVVESAPVKKIPLAEDDLPDWEAKKPEPTPEPAKPAKKAPAVQAITTFYDVSSLEGDVKQKAIKYLVDCLAEEIRPDIYQTKVKLKRLTSCIIPEEAALEFPNI